MASKRKLYFRKTRYLLIPFPQTCWLQTFESLLSVRTCSTRRPFHFVLVGFTARFTWRYILSCDPFIQSWMNINTHQQKRNCKEWVIDRVKLLRLTLPFCDRELDLFIRVHRMIKMGPNLRRQCSLKAITLVNEDVVFTKQVHTFFRDQFFRDLFLWTTACVATTSLPVTIVSEYTPLCELYLPCPCSIGDADAPIR